MKKRKCFDCDEIATHKHHVVPKSKGGRATVPLCATCHAKAHDRDALRLAEAAWVKRKRAGKVYGGIPYGKRRGKNDKLVVDKRESQILRIIKRMRKLGCYGREIADELNRRGYRNRAGRLWSGDSVQKQIRSLNKNDDSSGPSGTR